MKKPAKKPTKKLAIRDVASKKTAAVKGGGFLPIAGRPIKQPMNKCLPLCTSAPYNSDASVYAGFYGA